MTTCSSNLRPFNEDEILTRFKICSHDIGDKVISLSEDVLMTCNNWRDPKSNVKKLEEAMHDPCKRHLVFYDMWNDEVVQEIVNLLRRWCRNRCWTSIEFRGCQERHVNAVLQCALEMDIVQTVAFSLTNDRFDPRRRSNNSTFDIISRTVDAYANQRLECVIFHQRPFHFLQYESLKDLKVKRLHFLEKAMLHPQEIAELARGLEANTSLESFSFLGGITHMIEGNDVSKLVCALTSHPSLRRLSLNLRSTMAFGVSGLESLLASQNSALKCLTLTGGFPFNTFFPPGTFSQGLKSTKVKHLHLRDIFLFDHDVQDLAVGMQANQSLRSFSLKVDADSAIDISSIAFAVQSNLRLERLSLSGKCSVGNGVHGIAKLLSSETCQLRDLHLSGAFQEVEKRAPQFLEIFSNGLRGNKSLHSLDLSCNGFNDKDVITVYNVVWTCPHLSNLDLGMNEITSNAIESFAESTEKTNLGVLRISSPYFSFFQINDKLCQTLVQLLSKNPRLGDVNFNMGHIEWHDSYSTKDGKMKWHHFFPAFRVHSLHSNNKRVEYLKTKELKPEGLKDLAKVQLLLDSNWAGRSLGSQQKPLPLGGWPKVFERVMNGRTCFWTGRQEAPSNLMHQYDVSYSLLRGNLSSFLRPVPSNPETKRPNECLELGSAKKQRIS